MEKNENKPPKKNAQNARFLLIMAICIVVWAIAFPFIKLALTDLSYISLTILRFSVVCTASLVILATQSKKFSRLQKRDILPIFLLGFFGVLVYHFGLNYGEQTVSPSIASLLIATIPIFSVLFATMFLKEKITIAILTGIALALTGVIIISLWGIQNTSFEVKYYYGIITILIAALMGSLYTIAGKKLLTRYSPLSLTIYAMLLGSLVLIPIALITPSFPSEILHMSLRSWFAVLFLGLCSTVIGYVLWYVGLEMTSAARVSGFLYGIPVLSTIISYLLFDDRLTILFFVGGFFVICGLSVINKKEKKNLNKVSE